MKFEKEPKKIFETLIKIKNFVGNKGEKCWKKLKKNSKNLKEIEGKFERNFRKTKEN